ncbi:MAG TPA: EF-hand domain-containing protein [Burkholderiales bacterium]
MTPGLRQGRTLFLTYLCCAWVAVLLAIPLASAMEPASGGATRLPAPAFEWVDRDHDGTVSRLESAAVRGLLTRYSQADLDGDGRIDRAEYVQAMRGKTK